MSGIVSRTKKKFFKIVRFIPAVRRKINKEIEKVSHDLENDVVKRTEGSLYYTKLPYDPFTKTHILDLVDQYLALGNYNWKGGRVSGAVYNYEDDLTNLVADVYRKTSYTNPLHPDIFPGVCKMEAEVVRMSAELFHGNADAVGTVNIQFVLSLKLKKKIY